MENLIAVIMDLTGMEIVLHTSLMRLREVRASGKNTRSLEASAHQRLHVMISLRGDLASFPIERA